MTRAAPPTPPRLPPDPRQRASAATMDAFAADARAKGATNVATANLAEGYPASHVDLGAVREALRPVLRGWTAARVAREPREAHRRLGDALASWVQRVKQTELRATGDYAAAPFLWFATKDDLGWYEHGFYVALGEEP
jgi:hypothetical protein